MVPFLLYIAREKALTVLGCEGGGPTTNRKRIHEWVTL